MENYVGMNELLEIIFGKKPTIREEKVAHSSIPSSCLTEDFREIMYKVLFFKVVIIDKSHEKFFTCHIRKALSSHEEYLRYIMSACLRECEENLCIFESFLSVCAFVKYMTEQTSLKTKVNYFQLNSDIFMVFYQKVLRKSFLKHKGFYKFLKYIRSHRYLEWHRKKNDSRTSGGDQTLNIHLSLIQDIDEESRKYYYFEELLQDRKSSKKVNARSLALEVLSNTSVKLPTLPSETDLIMRLVASAKRQIAKKADIIGRLQATSENETLHKNQSLKPDAKASYPAEQQEDIARHEDVIQAVIRHNQSKNSDSNNAKNQIPKEADRILEHLKNSIKSLTEILGEYDEE